MTDYSKGMAKITQKCNIQVNSMTFHDIHLQKEFDIQKALHLDVVVDSMKEYITVAVFSFTASNDCRACTWYLNTER